MKLFHIADLHIGRRVGEFNLLDDQRIILDQILSLCDEEKPDGVLIAGDVYDKGLPAGEAVELLDDFLTGLVSRRLPVFMISGNHDSPERLNFASRILKKNDVHIAGVFDGGLRKAVLEDSFGRVNIYLLPYLKPALVRPYYESKIESYDDAVRAVASSADIDIRERNILVAHQFVTCNMQEPLRSDSESLNVGGLDNVDVSAFESFDYVALGHLHGPQHIGRETIRYSGSPIKYSFSEARQNKSVTVLELGEKGDTQIHMLPLRHIRDMREIKGPIKELLNAGEQNGETSQDYIHATLTDEEEIYDALGKLRNVYPNLMYLDFENRRTLQNVASKTSASGDVARKTPMDLFAEFYSNQNNEELNLEQRRIMEEIFEKIGGSQL